MFANSNYVMFRVSSDAPELIVPGTTDSDPYDDEVVRSWDQRLHRALSDDEIRKLIPAPRKPTEKNYIFELILEQEPTLGEIFPKESKLSLLWIAALSCYQDSAELLVRSGADVNEPCRLRKIYIEELTFKSTVLHVLIPMYPSAWNVSFIDLLMEHGADLNARDSDDSTPLHIAVKYGRVQLAEVLLEKGVDVNAVGRFGRTPLLEAARTSEFGQLMQLLMEHGADIFARDNSGSNVLYHLVESSRGEHVDQARILIGQGVSLHEARECGRGGYWPMIHSAVSEGKVGLASLFLEHGADANAPIGDNETPLHVAAWKCRNPAMLQALLKRGANIELRNNSGDTALHKLAGSDKSTIEEKMKILLSVGANVFAERNDGLTAFDVIYQKNVECVPIMLKALALRKACQEPTIEFNDERILKERHPELWNHYEACLEEIVRVKACAEFVRTGVIFELLAKCPCWMEPIMRNLEFTRKFVCYSFGNVFTIYAEDIFEAYERAERYYESVLDLEELISEAYYNVLPYLVVRKVAFYAMDCDICEMKKSVQESRHERMIE